MPMSSVRQASLLLHSNSSSSSSSSNWRCLTARRLTPPDTLPQPLLSRQAPVLRCSYTDDFKGVEDAPPAVPFTPSELNLPLASQAPSQSAAQTQQQQEEAIGGDAKAAVKNDNVLDAATRTLDELTVAQLAVYGAVFAGGLFFLEAILNSFEVLPLFPETLQLIGVLYSILLASRMFQGKPVTLTPSPIKAITDMVERDGTKLQRTSLSLPQDLDARVLAAFEKLRNERDRAVNEMVSLRTKVADYARVVAEKEALETVAMQLAQERDEAITEVVELKIAVDAMSERMRVVEKTLQQELGPLRESTCALETVAVQLASERDTALKELSELRKDLDLAKCKEEEKIALENLAFQLTKERDQATSENETLKKMLAEIQNAGDSLSGLSPEEEMSLKARIAAGSQYIDLDKPYDNQKEQVDNFVSHLVDEYGAPPGWTKKYLKQFLEFSALKSKTNIESSSQVEAEISS